MEMDVSVMNYQFSHPKQKQFLNHYQNLKQFFSIVFDKKKRKMINLSSEWA